MGNDFQTPLCAVEQKFKEYYKMNSERHLDQPCDREDVLDILKSVSAFQPSDVLFTEGTIVEDHSFFHENLDIAFVRHYRYIPAFWHKHEFFEILFVIQGECHNHIMDSHMSMHCGDICIIAPGFQHSVSAFSDDAYILNILVRKSTFEESFLGLLKDDNILSDFFKRTFYDTTEIPYLLFHTKERSGLLEYISELKTEYQSNKRFKRQMLNFILSQFFIVLLREYEHTLEIPNIILNKTDENLLFILHYIQANYNTVTLKELSRFFNYSERQLQRILLKSTGLTFTEIVQKQQMIKATMLLQYGDIPISQICEETGFHSQNNFRKIFIRTYQMTPSEYRKKYRLAKEISVGDIGKSGRKLREITSK